MRVRPHSTEDSQLPDEREWHRLKSSRPHCSAVSHLSHLLLTARDSVEDKVAGLELGADDHLAKPFAYAELLARIRSLLRRTQQDGREVLQIADLEIDLIKRRVRRTGTRIDLTAQEFALLQLLAEREGEILTRAFITSQVWDMNFDSDTNVVDVAMRRLRAKVDCFEPKLLHTVRGMGYVLENRSE